MGSKWPTRTTNTASWARRRRITANGPLLLQVDSSLLNLFSVLEVSRETKPKKWSALNGLRQIRVCSFLFGLAVMFLIMASYVLAGDKRGLILAQSGFQFGGGYAVNVSALRDYERMKLVVKSIQAKVEFSGRRRKPKLKDLIDQEPHNSTETADGPLPKQLLWPILAPLPGGFPAAAALFSGTLGAERWEAVPVAMLPYFFIIGQPKCGTTDLFDRLRMHPEVRFTMFKEPHWWTRKRFGLIRLSERHDPFPVEDYLDLFEKAAHHIQGNATRERGGASRPQVIIGEGSASTMWDNNAWINVYENISKKEPPILVQDFIHALQPQARFIVMLRDPVERLYSDYLYFGIANKSAEDFHDKVSESLLLFQSCLADHSLRSCVYNTTANQAMPVRLHVGLYIVFLLDWLTLFSPEQILVLRLEDHASYTKFTMNQVFHFLNLGPMSKQLESDITRNPASNTRRPADKSLGPMLFSTKDLLTQFYKPFNQKLAKVLRNDSFLWESSS
ncbi:hypothetical protein WMY93_010006 [Mugilogobius chulae]|uniref:Sulfotransferase n=1 Tax=Mugilogobius chulae TaxID=88201 RepID=A0AAW0PF61_9GOBI